MPFRLIKSLKSCFKLSYAESHFKFKLPWSRIFKKEPTIFIDAPFQVALGNEWPVFVIAKNAHRFNTIIKRIDITITRDSDDKIIEKHALEPVMDLIQAFEFINLKINLKLNPGHYTLNAYFHTVNSKNQHFHFLNNNYKNAETLPLKVHFLGEALPYPPNFLAGEHHCHTHYTSDPVEFGASPEVLAKAAKCTGLDFVCLTDHSYNFYYDSIDYMRPIDPHKKFAEFLKETQTHSDKNLSLLAGIEVSVGNHLKQNVHLLTYLPNGFIEGHGDSGRRWLNNKPDLDIETLIEQNQGASFFAAHPKAQIGLIEKLIFNRGEWTEKDLNTKLNGLQFWNGHKNKSYDLGKAFWVKQLLKNHRLLPLGGNDAHGDLNYNISVAIPLFKFKSSRHHLFGKVRTLWPVANNNPYEINEAFKQDTCTLTDGPFASLIRRDEKMQIEFKSNSDFGPLQELRLIAGIFAAQSEVVVATWQDSLSILDSVFFEHDYYRLEGETQLGYSVLSSALFKSISL